jgi:glutamyl-tRNA synthetase
MTAPVRVRFAPSPTGYLHVGGARTAIFNYLYAKHCGGTFILRIEDTDQTRYNPEALESLMVDLKWLGLTWDEGPGIEGPHQPYFQSQRLPAYQEQAQRLIDNGSAYPCFCTGERLDELRETQKRNSLPTSYDRRCRNLPLETAKERVAAGESHTVRLKVPFHGTTTFTDQLRGKIEYQNRVLDDLVLLKSDGFPTYHLANVVDDHAMEITHVLRGDEWIPSTPRHILIYQALGYEPPVFCHLPVILAEGGGKLSKRRGAASVGDYRDLGYLPETMVNFLSLLGWAPGEDLEFMERPVLVEKFTLDRINPKSAAFDERKLEWLNGQYFQQRTPEFFLPLVKPLWEKAGASVSEFGDAYAIQALGLMKDRSKKLTDFVEFGLYFFKDPEEYEAKGAAKHFKPGIDTLLSDLADGAGSLSDNAATSFEDLYRREAEARGKKAAELIHPTRLALAGMPFGPGLFELMEVLGRETVVRRLRKAAAFIQAGT